MKTIKDLIPHLNTAEGLDLTVDSIYVAPACISFHFCFERPDSQRILIAITFEARLVDDKLVLQPRCGMSPTESEAFAGWSAAIIRSHLFTAWALQTLKATFCHDYQETP